MHILGGAGLHSPFLEKTFDTNLTLRFFFFSFSVLFSHNVICGIKVNVNDFDVIIYSSYFLNSDAIL